MKIVDVCAIISTLFIALILAGFIFILVKYDLLHFFKNLQEFLKCPK